MRGLGTRGLGCMFRVNMWESVGNIFGGSGLVKTGMVSNSTAGLEKDQSTQGFGVYTVTLL